MGEEVTKTNKKKSTKSNTTKAKTTKKSNSTKGTKTKTTAKSNSTKSTKTSVKPDVKKEEKAIIATEEVIAKSNKNADNTMSEKKKALILLGIASVFAIFVLIGVISSMLKSKEELNKFKNYYNSEEQVLVVLRKDNCSYCQAFEPELEFMSNYYNFKYEEVSVDKLNASHYNELLKMIGLDSDNFGTPHTVVVQNGKVIDSLQGAEEEDKILTFLKNNGFVESDAQLLINYIDYTGYLEVLNSKDINVIALGQTSCIYCKISKPTLNEIIKDYKININFLNIDTLSKEEQQDLYKTLDFYSDEEWGTPTFLIVQDGKLLQYIGGAQPKEIFIETFKKIGLINE